MVLKEANAAGTAWLRAGLLPEAHRGPARELLARFVDTRIKYQQTGYDAALVAEGRIGCGVSHCSSSVIRRF